MRLLLLFLTLFSSLVFAQDPYLVKYSIEEGLPTSNIYSVFEDSKGYIWFGTDVGALKFDGYNFEHFSTDEGLADNEVFRIFEDSKHRIWFVTLNGKLSFYFNDHFENSNTNKVLKAASHPKMITDIYEHDNKIVVLYRDGFISKIDLDINSISLENVNTPLFGYWIHDNDVLYLTVENIINQSEKVIHSIKDKRNSSLGYRTVTHSNTFFFSIKDKVFEFDESQVIEHLSLDKEDIIHLSSFDELLFVGTKSGLFIKSQDKVTQYFLKDAVSFVLKDTQSNFWVTTLNNGIKFIPNFEIKQYQFYEDAIKVNALKVDKHKVLWIGTEKGLFSLSSKNDGTFGSINTVTENDYINKIRYYENVIFSIGNEKISIVDNSTIKTLKFGANDFYYDSEKYVLSSSIVFKFNPLELKNFPKTRNENRANSQDLKKFALFKKRTNVILKYEQNSILFGTSLGLFCYKKDSIYQINKQSEELNTSILDLYYNAEKAELLVATNSKGISVLSNNKIIHHITKQENLSSNTCYSIKPYNNGYLIATNKGLDFITFNNNRIEVRNLNAELGLKKEKINAIETIDSLVFLATDKGLISFHANAIKAKKTKPKLVIDNVLINKMSNVDFMNLSSNQNNLSLYFTGISFADFENLNYEFSIDNEQWKQINNRSLEIKNLSDGKHNIQIRVSGQNNIWSDVKQLNLLIKKPFWKTLPFILFMILMFFLLTQFVVKKRIKTINYNFNLERKAFQSQREKTVLEKRAIELEQKALRLQMNPHFIFNALNTIKGYYSGGNIKEANRYISKFSKLLRLILENDEHLISLEREIEILELYIKLIQIRYKNVFDFKLKLGSSIKIEDIGIPPLLIQPIVENAIVHGLAPQKGKGNLQICFHIKNQKLICIVKDDGVGYSNSKMKNKNRSHQSKAIEITRERINFENNSTAKNNFQIIDLENPSGTEVVIKIPLINLWK